MRILGGPKGSPGPDRFERRCRRCDRVLHAHQSRQVRLCSDCSKARPGYEARIRTLLRYAGLRKRRNVLRLQMSHNGNEADCYHVVIPAHLIGELGWSKGEKIAVRTIAGMGVVFVRHQDSRRSSV